MENNSFYDVYYDVKVAIDKAFDGRQLINLYQYLESKGAKRDQVEEFLSSSTCTEIKNLVQDLSDYLEGGNDDTHKQLREGYGHLPKPEARKIRNYLQQMLDDAEKYHYDKRPGRRKKSSK